MHRQQAHPALLALQHPPAGRDAPPPASPAKELTQTDDVGSGRRKSGCSTGSTSKVMRQSPPALLHFRLWHRSYCSSGDCDCSSCGTTAVTKRQQGEGMPSRSPLQRCGHTVAWIWEASTRLALQLPKASCAQG